MNSATGYATTKNRNGKFRQGTIIEVKGCEKKADAGRFVLNAPFLPQGEGRAYFQWTRLGANGERLKRQTTNNLRGEHSRTVAQWEAAGILTIVSEPEVHPACCGCAACEEAIES